MLFCLFCNKSFTNAGGHAAHAKHCKDNPNRIPFVRSPNAGRKKGAIPWNKGLSGDIRCKKSEEEKLARKGKSTGKASSPEKELERIAKITARAKITHKKNGGYRQGSGRGKKGWYKGFFCDSSWELAYVVYCLDHNIDIKRNTEKRTYFWKNKEHSYTPDFIVNQKLVEIKGYWSQQWEAKRIANPDVQVLYKDDIKPFIDYAKITYGNKFTTLYENRG